MDAPNKIEELSRNLRAGVHVDTRSIYDATLDHPLDDEDNLLEFGLLMADAAELLRTDLVEYLLNAGCELGVPIFEGAINGAIDQKSTAVFDLLLKYHEKWGINQPCMPTGLPILGHAVTDSDLTDWCFSQGADPNIMNNKDYTPFSLAVEYAPIAVINKFLDNGGDVNQGWLLHHAVLRNIQEEGEQDVDVIELLFNNYLDSGCLDMVMSSRNERFNDPRFGFGTPLHYAAKEKKERLVRYLLELGAKPTVVDSSGHVAEHWANGHRAIVSLLQSHVPTRNDSVYSTYTA